MTIELDPSPRVVVEHTAANELTRMSQSTKRQLHAAPSPAGASVGCRQGPVGALSCHLQHLRSGSTYALSVIAKPMARSLFGLAIVASFCLGWTVWLMLLTATPNATANRIMNTEIFDDGSFWRFIDPSPAMLAVGLGGLGIVALGYVYIIARVTFFRHREFISWSGRSPQKISVQWHFSLFKRRMSAVAAAPIVTELDNEAGEKSNSVLVRQAATVALRLVTIDSSTRKFVNVSLKLVDLGIQFILLADVMERGLPVVLVVFITSLILLNSLSTALVIAILPQRAGLYALLLDTSFDICIAIVYPMIVALYCMSTFSIDRQALAINMDIFPPGWFERGASTISDPVEVEVIRAAFNSLRIFSTLSAFARIGTNLALCRRFYQLAARIKDPDKWKRVLYPKKRTLAVVFALIAVTAVVLVEESVRASNIACRHHPECVQNARRWVKLRNDGDHSQCPCLTMIDVDTRLKSFDEWLSSPDVTLKMAQLAASGDLQTIDLINRQLPAFPDELWRCKNLKHLSLVYTHTKALPAWTKEFMQLECLHIEAKLSISSRVDMSDDMPDDMPDDMSDDLFEDMGSLTFIYFGINEVKQLPSFDGLTNLRSFVIGVFVHLVELPSFQSLGNLERLVLASLPLMKTVPDLVWTPKLKAFAVLDRGEFCRNGMFEKFLATVCAGQGLVLAQAETGPSRQLTPQYNGTMYKRCMVPGYNEAMCYNLRLMGITCDNNPFPVEMRRRQIAEGVDDPCDLELEAWLDCR